MAAVLPPHSFYVVSYPRSGNTWLINCLTMLLDAVRGQSYTPFKLYTELHGNPDPGFHFWCEPRQRPDQPICVKSHDNLPAFRLRHPPSPIVYIARDARDCLLSYYFFQQAFPSAEKEELSNLHIHGTDILISRGGCDPVFRPDDFSDFIRQEAPIWAAHVTSARQSNDVYFVTYEGLTMDFESSLRGVVDYLKLPIVRSYADTQNVYHAGFKAVFSGNNRDFFRSGRIGDWKNWYDPRHARLLDDLIGKDLLDLGFEQDPEWAANYTPVRVS
jgi:hypothetical protein